MKNKRQIFMIMTLILLVGTLAFVFATPIINTIVLNSTSGNNLTSDNLTIYTDQDSNTSIKLIYDWKKDGVGLTVLNMPFEGGSNSTWTKDYSDGSNNGTVVGATWSATSGHDGFGAYEFDGNNDYIKSISGSSIEYKTLEFWINNDRNVTKSSGYQMVTSFGTGSNEWITSGSCCSSIADETFNLAYGGGVTYIKDNYAQGWHHVAFVWDGANYDIYLDGLERNTLYYSGGVGLVSETQVNLGVRLDASPDGWFDGHIDDFKVWNVSLSPEQISALYNNRTDMIVSHELEVSDVWQSCVTPNDGLDDGVVVCSNNLTVLNICTCPSSPQNWNVNMANNCVLNSVCNITGYDLTFYGSGNFTMNSTLYVNEILNLSDGMTIWMKPSGVIYNGAN